MKTERLTIDRIRRFACPTDKRQAFLFDTDAPRLAVRATANAKSFVFESKLNRQTIRRTIGDTRAWTLEDARAEARRLQTQIDQGIDPREVDREKARVKLAEREAAEASAKDAERRQRFTLQALTSSYVDHLAAKGKLKTARDARSAFKVHVVEAWPQTANTAASEITPAQLAAIVRKVREAGKERTAGILRNYLVAAYNAARRAPFDSGIASALIEFGITTNPAEAIPAIPVRAGDRTLSTTELRAYIKSLGHSDTDAALRVALHAGGQRMAQLLRTTVTDFDADTGVLRMWDTKGKRKMPREHLVPLAPNAAALVSDLAKKRPNPDSPIFAVSERAAGDRVAEISATLGGTPFDLRDIRRTTETMLASMRISKDTRAQLLSHGISGVQATHYDRHDYIDEKRAALVAWEGRIDEIEQGTASANNIISLRA